AATNIRLVGGKTPFSGRLEVKNGSEWGTVCDDHFKEENALVVCRMLGFNNPVHASFSTNGDKSDESRILLDEVNCTGQETDISECTHNGWGITDCTHSEDIGIDCRMYKYIYVKIFPNEACCVTSEEIVVDNCSLGTPIRLVNGTSAQSGRVEVEYGGGWGTICDDHFDDQDAKVVCRMLGFSDKRSRSLSGAYYGEGQGNIFIDELRCQGTEQDILECKSNEWLSPTNCQHNEDAAVRLQGSPQKFVGRLEILKGAEWKGVCSNGFNNNTATVVCKSLGFERGYSYFAGVLDIQQSTDMQFRLTNGPSVKAGQVEVMYKGSWIGFCTNQQIGVFEANMICEKLGYNQRYTLHHVNSYNSTVRLVNGTSERSGRVEILHQGRWGTICADHFDIHVADVVCRKAGIRLCT
ncbi:DMBT1-like protein, partial [Mya arenaria]